MRLPGALQRFFPFKGAEDNEQRQRESIVKARAYSGEAEQEHKILLLEVACLLLVGIICWQSYSWRMHANRLAEKQWIVFQVPPDGNTTTSDVSKYQTGPTDEEIRARAWELFRYIAGASSNDVDTYFQEAMQLMVPELREEFVRNFGDTYRRRIKSQGIYSKLENGIVRQMTEEDLPQGSRIKPTRYDVIVKAILNRYSLEDGTRISSGPVSFQLKLTPLAERTVQNPTALLVEQISTIDFEDPQKEEKKEEKGK